MLTPFYMLCKMHIQLGKSLWEDGNLQQLGTLTGSGVCEPLTRESLKLECMTNCEDNKWNGGRVGAKEKCLVLCLKQQPQTFQRRGAQSRLY